MAQLTFADWMKAVATEDFRRFEQSLYDEAERQGGGLDYDELDHELDQLRAHHESAEDAWHGVTEPGPPS